MSQNKFLWLLIVLERRAFARGAIPVFLLLVITSVLLWVVVSGFRSVEPLAPMQAVSTPDQDVTVHSTDKNVASPEAPNARQILFTELANPRDVSIVSIKVSSLEQASQGGERFFISSIATYPAQKEFMREILQRFPQASLVSLKAQNSAPSQSVKFETVIDVFDLVD